MIGRFTANSLIIRYVKKGWSKILDCGMDKRAKKVNFTHFINIYRFQC